VKTITGHSWNPSRTFDPKGWKNTKASMTCDKKELQEDVCQRKTGISHSRIALVTALRETAGWPWVQLRVTRSQPGLPTRDPWAPCCMSRTEHAGWHMARFRTWSYHGDLNWGLSYTYSFSLRLLRIPISHSCCVVQNCVAFVSVFTLMWDYVNNNQPASLSAACCVDEVDSALENGIHISSFLS
jgi:hypothetical protein